MLFFLRIFTLCSAGMPTFPVAVRDFQLHFLGPLSGPWSDNKVYVEFYFFIFCIFGPVSTKSEQNKSAESEWKLDNNVCSGFYIAPGSETLVSIQVINCFPLIVSI